MKTTNPSQIILTVTPAAKYFITCADLAFKLELTNTTSRRIIFDQDNSRGYLTLVDASGTSVTPTGKEPTADTSIVYREIDSKTTIVFDTLESKYLNAPFAATDCKTGNYTATVDLYIPGAFIIKSKPIPVHSRNA